jgi:hypothetical protein
MNVVTSALPAVHMRSTLEDRSMKPACRAIVLLSLAVLPTGPVRPQSQQPPFDCKSASTKIERAICGDRTLETGNGTLGDITEMTAVVRVFNERFPLGKYSGEDVHFSLLERGLAQLVDAKIPMAIEKMPTERCAYQLGILYDNKTKIIEDRL